MVEEKKVSTEQLEDQVSHWYFSVYTFVFKIFPVFLVILCAGILFYFFVLTGNDENTEEVVKEKTLIQTSVKNNYERLFSLSEISDDVKILIQDWYLHQDDDILDSLWNLLRVKGWIMPNIVHTNILSLPDIHSFSSSGYDVKQLEKIIKDIVVDTPDSFDSVSVSREVLPISDIEKTFSLSCLNGVKLNNYVCNKYVESFLETFYLYDLDTIVPQLQSLYDHLDDNQKKEFCKGLEKYSLFTHSENIALWWLMRNCWKLPLLIYSRNKDFYITKKFIEKAIVWDMKSRNMQTNIYLILSLQQAITKDIKDKHININMIYSYLSLVDTVMLSDTTVNIKKIYYDWMFWFNEYILKKGLEKARYSQSHLQSDIERLIPQINKINNGKKSMGIKWLKDSLLNPAIASLGARVDDEIEKHTFEPLQRISDLANDLSFFVLIEDYYKDPEKKDIVVLKWYFMPQYEWERYKLYSTVEIAVRDFRVVALDIQNYANFTKTLNILIEKNFFSLPDLYNYIKKNIKFYLTDQGTDFCSLLKGAFGGDTSPHFQKEVKSSSLDGQHKNTIYDVYCTEKKVYISWSGVNYSLTLDGLSIKKIRVNNPELEKILNTKFSLDVSTTEIDLVNLIQDIVYYQKPEEKQQIFTGSTKVIVVLDKIKEYMNIRATDVVEQGDIILAEIIVQDIPFIIHYDFDSDTIKTIFFKWLKTSENSEHYLKVNNFDLQLHKNNQKVLNAFLIEPLEYIKKKSPYVYLQYLRLTKNKDVNKNNRI